MKYKILVVDDEEDIRSLLKDFFEMENYLVYTASNGREALEKIEVNPDIILLDINMPDINGLEVCKSIRNFVNCPILFLTARVKENERVQGLMMGGDDYILKPFSIEELHARVLAHLRREERNNNGSNRIKCLNDLIINYSNREVFYNEEPISFTKTEFEIIEILSMNVGQVFTKEQIYERIWGFDKEGNSNIITEHIRRIRMKFAKYSVKTYIETAWGVGYRWIG
jgi:Response regulators consisting of a CheY-like receiver domain and a winged-helix DNA-binding domain